MSKPRMVDEPTTLDPNDAAVVFKSDGQVEGLIPKMGPQELVPDHVVFAMAVAMRLHDDEAWREDAMEWFHEKMSEMDDGEAA